MNKEFNSSNEVIVEFCGEYPSDFENKDISSDPNFVFENDGFTFNGIFTAD